MATHLPGADSTWLDLQSAMPVRAVLGIGAWEQHGPHLPLDTDFFFAEAVSRRVAERLDAFLLHTLPYSTSLEHLDFPGTVTLSPDTLKNVVWDIARSCGLWGVRTLALVNGHGGNFVLNPTVRQWNMERRDPRIILVDFFAAWTDIAPNLHADEAETSLMMHLAPQRVREDNLRDFVPQRPREDLTHVGMRALSPEGQWGFPTRATAEQGVRRLEQAVRYSVQRVLDLEQAFSEHRG